MPPAGLVFEAEALASSNSGTGTSVQVDPQTGGGSWISLDAENAGSWMEFALPEVPAGSYTLKLRYKSNSDRGTVAVWVDGTSMAAQVGEEIDQYSSPQAYHTVALGDLSFAAPGAHRIRMVIAGKNPASRGFVGSADAFILE
jgi:hypothetical protein